MKKQRYSLVGIIVEDLFKQQKLSLFFIVLIIVSALAILMTTQQTRLLLNQRERLILERDVLESEWRNLILEENVLIDQKRIEREAISKLNMRYVAQKDETVVVIKNK